MKTEIKSNIALIKAKLTLLEMGYCVFESEVDYRLPFDLIAVGSSGLIKKIQVKYSGDGVAIAATGYQSVKQGGHVRVKYDCNSFDYYAMYLPDVDTVVFPSVAFAGKTIATTIRNTNASFYWYEDFLSFTDTAEKKTCRDFGREPSFVSARKNKKRPEAYKVERPTKEELSKLLWELPTTQIGLMYGVSDSAVARWAVDYNISKPPRGYWTKQKSIPS